MNTKPKLFSLAAAMLLGGLMAASSRAPGQAVKISGLTHPIIPYQQVSAPLFTPAPGTYVSYFPPVVITSATSGAYIRYVISTDPATPPPTPASGTLYSGPVYFSSLAYSYTAKLQAIAYTGYVNLYPSVVTVGYYTIVPPLPRRP